MAFSGIDVRLKIQDMTEVGPWEISLMYLYFIHCDTSLPHTSTTFILALNGSDTESKRCIPHVDTSCIPTRFVGNASFVCAFISQTPSKQPPHSMSIVYIT